jgi:maltose/moltooligosaccharide transporter
MANHTVLDDSLAKSPLQAMRQLSISEIINMSFGFMGIQMGFALQNGNMSAIFQHFGVAEDKLALLWLAGPVTGLLVQPIIGYYSDRTWHPTWGRRRPYFMIGAILATISLCLMPNSVSLWMAAGMFWIMDASFNITMEPFRAVVGDKLPSEQRTLGFAVQTIFIGLGAWIASQLPTLFTMMGVSNTAPEGVIPDTIKYSFYMGALGFLLCVLYTVFTTKENPPTEEELLEMQNDKKGIFDGIIASFAGIAEMPKEMLQLAAVQFFSWLALFHMWIYTTPAVTNYLYHTTDASSAAYGEGSNLVGSSFGTYNIVSAIVGFILPFLAAKLSRKVTHTICLTLGGIALIAIRFLPDPSWMHIVAIGIGCAWSSILTMPYAMLTNVLPANRMGYFVGVFNFFIVIPQIVAGSFSGLYIKLLGGDAMTGVTIGGISMLIAGLLALRVKDEA